MTGRIITPLTKWGSVWGTSVTVPVTIKTSSLSHRSDRYVKPEMIFSCNYLNIQMKMSAHAHWFH